MIYKIYTFILGIFCFINCQAQLIDPYAGNLKQVIKSPSIPTHVSFCGEIIPLEDFDTKESLMREMNSICYWHSSMIYTLQLADRYMEPIERILKTNNIPDDMKYLCVAESNMQNVVSPAGAAGFWQFMPATGKEYGLEINTDIDERYNLDKATNAACKYLKEAYNIYKNWSLAAASYNVGQGHISKQIEIQKQKSYYDLHLNTETSRYVFRAIAFKIIMENPEKYGFFVQKNELTPLKYKEIKVSGTVDWVNFSIKNGTTYKLIRFFNPWIRSTQMTNKSNKTYIVRVPL